MEPKYKAPAPSTAKFICPWQGGSLKIGEEIAGSAIFGVEPVETAGAGVDDNAVMVGDYATDEWLPGPGSGLATLESHATKAFLGDVGVPCGGIGDEHAFQIKAGSNAMEAQYVSPWQPPGPL